MKYFSILDLLSINYFCYAQNCTIASPDKKYSRLTV
jgi:hypothetical protein